MEKIISNSAKFFDLNKIFLVFLIFSLFTSFNIINISGFIVSFKKIMIFLSIIFIILSIKTAEINTQILVNTLILIIVFNLGNIINLSFNINSMILILSNVVFLALLMIFIKKNKLGLFFVKTWIVMGFLMSLIAILQTFGIFPQVQDNTLGLYSENHYSINQSSSSSLKRATGLFIDPNFFVTYLILSSILNRKFLKNRFFEIVIFFGVFATLSRMGLIALTLTYIFSNNYKTVISYLSILLTSVFLIFLFFPDIFNSFFINRFSEIFNLSTYINYNILEQVEMSSTIGRFLTLLAAKSIFFENLWFGIGIGNITLAYESILGFSTVSHNTFVEFFVLSGIFGVIPSYFLFKVLKDCFFSHEVVLQRMSVLFFVSFMLLSIITNVLLFYPIFFHQLILHIKNNE